LLETGVFDYSAATALRGAELVEAFRDPDMLAEGLERFSPPTNFWKRYRAELAKSAPVTVNQGVTGGALAVISRLQFWQFRLPSRARARARGRADRGQIEPVHTAEGSGDGVARPLALEAH
jgi:hypothetical protein